MIALLARLYQMFCETCRQYTAPDLSASGDYERYTCRVCGNSKEYRVK